MGRVAVVQTSRRVIEDGAHGLDIRCDPSKNPITAPHYADPGDDSQPLPGDYVALEDSSGAGAEQATGYADVRNEGKARPGEKRIYGRRPDGSVACDLWLKGDETIEVTFGGGGSFECRANGDVVINGVTIDRLGNISTAGEVTAQGELPVPIKLTSHAHPTAALGVLSAPVPFPPTP